MMKNLVFIFALVFVVLGVMGFINNPIFDIFMVDTVHNVVHLLSGIVAFIMASRGEASAKLFGKVFGIVYGLVAVLGFAMGGSIMGLMTVNTADNYLHVVLAVILLYIGFSPASTQKASTH